MKYSKMSEGLEKSCKTQKERMFYLHMRSIEEYAYHTKNCIRVCSEETFNTTMETEKIIPVGEDLYEFFHVTSLLKLTLRTLAELLLNETWFDMAQGNDILYVRAMDGGWAFRYTTGNGFHILKNKQNSEEEYEQMIQLVMNWIEKHSRKE